MGVHWSLSPGHVAPESTGQCAPHASDFTTFQPWAAVTGQMTADDGITPATGFGFPKLIDPSLDFTPSLTSFLDTPHPNTVEQKPGTTLIPQVPLL